MRIILIAGLTFFAASVYAGAPASAVAEEAAPAPDHKKKKPGEECRSSDECQGGHACVKSEKKNICVVIPRRVPPPT